MFISLSSHYHTTERNYSISHTSHLSTHPSTSPATDYSQTPSSPVSSSQHYAPHTSTVQTPPASSTRLTPPGRSAAVSSTTESPRHRPSRGTADRIDARRTSFSADAKARDGRGTMRLRRVGESSCCGLILQRPGGSRLEVWVLSLLLWGRQVGWRMVRRVLCWRMSSCSSRLRRTCMSYT